MNFKNLKNLDKYSKYSVCVIAAFAVVVLALTAIYHVSGDGCWHSQAGSFIAKNKRFPLFEPIGRNEPFWSPPLYHAAVAIVFAVFGKAAYSASKFISPIFGILSLVFSFLLAKKLYSPKIAFYSIVFLASIPIFIDYSVLGYVEAMLVFFAVVSVYFAVMQRPWLSGVAAGLASLTKYNGLFIIPVLLFIQFKRYGTARKFYVNSAKIMVPVMLICGPWLLRNWILLGNPIWPFFNSLFGGYLAPSYEASGVTTSFNPANIFHPNTLIFAYLGFFGVPDGNPAAFSFVNIPLIGIFIVLWVAMTAIFLLPLAFGLGKKGKRRDKKILAVWILSYFVLMLLYISNASWSVSRIILPALPAAAVFWAFGLEKMKYKYYKFYRIILSLIVLGFIIGIFAKISIGKNSWDRYEEDFGWIQKNTDENAMFIANGQCIPYNMRRTSMYLTPDNLEKADYLWMNQNFGLDRRSVYTTSEEALIKNNLKQEYHNNRTGTSVFSITR